MLPMHFSNNVHYHRCNIIYSLNGYRQDRFFLQLGPPQNSSIHNKVSIFHFYVSHIMNYRDGFYTNHPKIIKIFFYF